MWKQNYILVDEYFFFCCTWIVNSAYKDIYFGTKNDRLKIIQNTYLLNELLHQHGLNEKIRSQFVGTCLLALKNHLNYQKSSVNQIRAGIEEILTNLLNQDLNKAEKLVIFIKE